MGKLGAFFRHIKDAMRFNQLPAEQRVITFYSEGRNYWSYLEGLLLNVLNNSDYTVCYICSSDDDPGLDLSHPRLVTFRIGEGFVRDWMFANIDTKMMVMTMPDIHQYQVKRSLHDVHYVYVQHSLASLHMVYRPGAFDYYDTVFCAGPHHIKEIRAIEKLYNLPEKILFEHGYARLDSILSESKKRPKKKKMAADPIHYLLAPSWGGNGTVELGYGDKIVDALLAKGARVTFRPHPQTIKFALDKVQLIVDKHQSNEMFTYENNVRGQDSLHESDVMIGDWSGAALDYAFGLNKPVLFVDVPRKINNPYYEDIKIEPFEVHMRDIIGAVISPKNIDEILDTKALEIPSGLAEKYAYNVGHSDEVGADELLALAKRLTAK